MLVFCVVKVLKADLVKGVGGTDLVQKMQLPV